MHELAALRQVSTACLPWDEAAIPATELSAMLALHVKAPRGEKPTLSLPRPYGTLESGQVECLCLGPNEWLLLASRSDKVALAEFRQKLELAGAAMSEAQDRLIILELQLSPSFSG